MCEKSKKITYNHLILQSYFHCDVQSSLFTESIALYTLEFILLLQSAIILPITTSNPDDVA